MKYLIAIDSDGTLRHSDGTISDRTKKVIQKLITLGNIVVICTARPRYHTLSISKKVGINNYLISSNGTEVYDNLENKNIFTSYLSKNICKKIYSDIVKLGIRGIFVTDNTEYATQFTRNNNQILLDDTNKSDLLEKNIKQIMIIGSEKDKINEYKKYAVEKYNQNIIDSFDEGKSEISFSIISNHASKGIALKKLAKYLNIPLDKTIAIGNDKNDISMFETSGLSVAVANAADDVKKKANLITSSNDEDGLADFLEKLY